MLNDTQKHIDDIELHHAHFNIVTTDETVNDIKLLEEWRLVFPDKVIKKTNVQLLNILLDATHKREFSCLCSLSWYLYLDKLFNFCEFELLIHLINNEDKHPIYDDKHNYFFGPDDMESRIKYVESLLVEYKTSNNK